MNDISIGELTCMYTFVHRCNSAYILYVAAQLLSTNLSGKLLDLVSTFLFFFAESCSKLLAASFNEVASILSMLIRLRHSTGNRVVLCLLYMIKVVLLLAAVNLGLKNKAQIKYCTLITLKCSLRLAALLVFFALEQSWQTSKKNLSNPGMRIQTDTFEKLIKPR